MHSFSDVRSREQLDNFNITAMSFDAPSVVFDASLKYRLNLTRKH